MNPVELIALFTLDDQQFRLRFRHTPLWRAHRRGLLRNAAIVLGNQRHEAALPALAVGLGDKEPLVRSACAWALGELRNASAGALLQQAAEKETEASVSHEIAAALQQYTKRA